jgi:hypothetical protein
VPATHVRSGLRPSFSVTLFLVRAGSEATSPREPSSRLRVVSPFQKASYVSPSCWLPALVGDATRWPKKNPFRVETRRMRAYE